MFVRASALVLAIAASAIAAPSSGSTSSQCDTSNLQCCNGNMPTSEITESISSLLGLAGLTLPISGILNFGCSPITAIGTGAGATCQQQPICCSNNNQNGLVNVACTPLDLNL